MRSSSKRSSNRDPGFTLLEVLVALAILAAALTAGFRAVGMATGSAGELRARSLAEYVAQNRLAEHRIREEDFTETGTYTGNATQAGLTFRWHETVAATPNPMFRRIDVRVFAETDDTHALCTLGGFLVKPLK